MRWISRWFRSPAVPRVSITVLPIAEHEGTANCRSALEHALAVLDDRLLPATWGIARKMRDFQLAESLVACRSAHELAFVLGRDDLANEVASFDEFSRLAQRVELPLRTLMSEGRGVHPSLLTQWRVEAVVPLDPGAAPSPTGSLRALTWGVWEVPVTDRLATPATNTELARLKARLRTVISQSTRMHLVWQLGTPSELRLWKRVYDLLDLVAEFHQRGWLTVDTVGSAAAEVSRLATPHMAA